jgi:acetyl-CoA carboxylase biotin carboxylase subunit
MIKKVLIANRGEIAVRIIRACKEMMIQTVAVYSKVDQESLHVMIADESVCIGEAKAKDTYLNKNNIIQAAISTNCDAIHPGFGFLSENPLFAKLVEDCGLIFIGPKSEIIESLGDKNKARKLMHQANVPFVQGSEDIVETVEEGYKIASEIGYPIIIKAVNGGGGRGMRICYLEDEFKDNFNAAKSESLACFDSDKVYIEKFIENPRHIEIQIIGDNFGNVIHLYERDCSFQRRNQKMIEEAPSSNLSQELKNDLYQASVRACKYVGYNSVGTIEYLVSNDKFYFMEMNTRIQVEHPVTEMITSVDIIKEQIRVASNLKLSYQQKDIKCKGHAIECRINAENIKDNFSPSPGKINFISIPGGNGIRVETSVYSGYVITPFYDSMILKLIAYAPTRLEAIRKMRSALSELIIEGVKTNIEFHYYMMHQKDFVMAKYNTSLAGKIVEEIKNDPNLI